MAKFSPLKSFDPDNGDMAIFVIDNGGQRNRLVKSCKLHILYALVAAALLAAILFLIITHYLKRELPMSFSKIAI